MYCEYSSDSVLLFLVGVLFRIEDIRLSKSFSDAKSADFDGGCLCSCGVLPLISFLGCNL